MNQHQRLLSRDPQWITRAQVMVTYNLVSIIIQHITLRFFLQLFQHLKMIYLFIVTLLERHLRVTMGKPRFTNNDMSFLATYISCPGH